MSGKVDGNISGDGATSLTVHPERSRTMRLLQSTLKPLRPRLVAPPKKPFPAGSQKMTAPSSVQKKYRIEEHCHQGVWSYELIPKGVPLEVSKPRHNVYYFVGGSFQSMPSSSHWKTLSELSARLHASGKATARIHVVSPPLAPSSPAEESLRSLRAWLEEILEEAKREGWTVSLAGDSSGGNLAATLAIGACGGWESAATGKEVADPKPARANSLTAVESGKSDESAKSEQAAARLNANVVDSATQPESTMAAATTTTTTENTTEAVSNVKDMLSIGRSPNVSALTHILLICPALDMRNTNPDIAVVSAIDPLLCIEHTTAVAECWRGATNLTSHYSNWDAVNKSGDKSGQADKGGDSDETNQRSRGVMSASDPRLTPLLADLNLLRECDVVVDGLIAGLDSLGPDAKNFVGKLREANVPGDWEVWENMMHCWPLMAWSKLQEPVAGLAWMVERIQRAGARAGGAEVSH